MLIGILMAGTGVFFMAHIKKSNIKKATPNAVSILFFISGMAAILASVLNQENLVFASISVGIGCLLVWITIFNLSKVFSCTQAVPGRYCGFHACGGYRGHTYYSPVFSYCIDGKKYELQSGESFSLRYLKKRYQEGNTYDIYVHPKKTELFLSKKQFRLSDIFCLLMGAMLIWLAVVFVGIW